MSVARPAVTIVGAGGLGRALAAALGASGRVAVTIARRRPAAASVAAADIVVLAVPDRAVAPLARELRGLRDSWRGVVVLHAAGAHGPELLAPLRARGAATGVWHPMAVLGASGRAAFSGASARIEGSAKARTAARRLSRLVGVSPLPAAGLKTPRGRSSYHAAASLASNDVVALLAAAHGLLVRRGVEKRAALRALLALTDSAIAGVRRDGIHGALTGPVARNDGATLASQLRALERDDPAAGDAHRALSLRLTDLAEEAGKLSAQEAAALRRLLRRGRSRSATV